MSEIKLRPWTCLDDITHVYASSTQRGAIELAQKKGEVDIVYCDGERSCSDSYYLPRPLAELRARRDHLAKVIAEAEARELERRLAIPLRPIELVMLVNGVEKVISADVDLADEHFVPGAPKLKQCGDYYFRDLAGSLFSLKPEIQALVNRPV